jgi:hypothetical protein
MPVCVRVVGFEEIEGWNKIVNAPEIEANTVVFRDYSPIVIGQFVDGSPTPKNEQRITVLEVSNVEIANGLEIGAGPQSIQMLPNIASYLNIAYK